MKKILFTVLASLFIGGSFANTFYQQLCAFNPNWKKYPQSIVAQDQRNFRSDQAYVRAHLTEVLQVLEQADVQHLSKQQLASRKHLLNLLEGYKTAGRFPKNYYRKERIPVFIDEHDTHCAVGYLLQQTGHEKLARKIALQNNYAWVKEIQVEELIPWQQASGLSLEELKLIQGAYDFYRADAFHAINRFEIPQKPQVILAHFDAQAARRQKEPNPANIWLYGEGEKGVLNGRWEQKWRGGLPWIEGHYKAGLRTGKWKEYYQGTTKLCRTEHWLNDELNGIRKRFDRKGNLIEEILFKDGNAVTKTNYDLEENLVFVREPRANDRVWTQVYDTNGFLLATGHEAVHNPGNLSWFQNIELTALNTAAITARDGGVANARSWFPRRGTRYLNQPTRLFSTQPLVEYKKEGDWMYFKTGLKPGVFEYFLKLEIDAVATYSHHYDSGLLQAAEWFGEAPITNAYDLVRVVYKDNALQDLYAYGTDEVRHLKLQYHPTPPANQVQLNNLQVFPYTQQTTPPLLQVKAAGELTSSGEKIGVWKHYDPNGKAIRTETFLVPFREEKESAVALE